MSLVLALETSCDETSAAVVADGRLVRSSLIASQVDIHCRYGGVVPEVAARRHLEAFLPVVDQALAEAGVDPAELDALAVTVGPGLAGALVVGVAAASALALAWEKPLVTVNHIEAHAYAAFLEPADQPAGGADDGQTQQGEPCPPLVVLVVSGGHTSLAELRRHVEFRLLGETRDDAAGEAFDKVARHFGLGYPGGPVIDRLAAGGDPEAYALPRPMLDRDGLDFSFSGLKTAAINLSREAERRGEELKLPDLAASFQAAVIDVLIAKSFQALEQTGHRRLAVTGGVAANRALRQALAERAAAKGVELVMPAPRYCTDNAAMVAGMAHYLLAHTTLGSRLPLRVNPALSLGGRQRARGRRRAASTKPDLRTPWE